MKITVVGAGYVGLVTGACLSEMGNHVVCLDVDQRKIDGLQVGIIPIHEPGLTELIKRNAAAGRLQFTTDVAAAVGHGTLQFIGVGTPPESQTILVRHLSSASALARCSRKARANGQAASAAISDQRSDS